MEAITFADVTKSFKDNWSKSTVLHHLTFSVRQSEIFGFLGPNGAGKSTTIKLLLNFIYPDSGSIHINGLCVRKEPFQQHIGYLPETPYFYENLTGLETLWFAGKASGVPSSKIREASFDALKRLKLDHAGNNKIKTYSKGMKQRLGLAMSLIHDPAIFILDEPMSGLDPMGRKLVADVILDLKKNGKTVFFSSHILSDIERLCDRIAIMNKGKLLYSGNVAELARKHTDMEAAFVQLIGEDEGAFNG